jgi:MFS family permease
LGITFSGVALGPVIGGVLIRATGSALSPFYLAATVHTLYAMYIFLIVPESQTKARAMGARQRRRISLERRHNDLSRVRMILKSTIGFLSPLAVLLPERVIVGGNPLKRSKRDWSLCLITASYGIAMSLVVGPDCISADISPNAYASFPAGSPHVHAPVCCRDFQVVTRNCKRESVKKSCGHI